MIEYLRSRLCADFGHGSQLRGIAACGTVSAPSLAPPARSRYVIDERKNSIIDSHQPTNLLEGHTEMNARFLENTHGDPIPRKKAGLGTVTTLTLRPLLCVPLLTAVACAFTPQYPVTGEASEASMVDGGDRTILVDVTGNRDRLLQEEDTLVDKRITVDDVSIGGTVRGDRRFVVRAVDGNQYEVHGTPQLSNLLQELTLAKDAGQATASLRWNAIYEAPVARVQRLIREVFWDGLTRRIDENHIARVLDDEKSSASDAKVNFIYVPKTDPKAKAYFEDVSRRRPELRLQVSVLPEKIDADYVRGLDGKHGILSLSIETDVDGKQRGVPFVVPGGRFNEMYGWDSYFEALGLLADGRVDLAKSMIDNLAYQIRHYGKILNANRTYYLTRSQPPFLTSMAISVYGHLPRGEPLSKAWLKDVMEIAISDYHNVWMGTDRLTETGLSRYFGAGKGPPPEVEEGHFDAVYDAFASKMTGIDGAELQKEYEAGNLTNTELDAFFVHDRCMRESGHDTTYRWQQDGDRCADFVTVDLNALLFKTEIDLATIIEEEFSGTLILKDGTEEKSGDWLARAASRREKMQALLWDEKLGLFFDYDTKKERRHHFVSATTFYPLWASSAEDNPAKRLVTREQARRIVAAALPHLEMPGGLAGTSKASRGTVSKTRPKRQWDYPFGWAPHQILAWRGLQNFGMNDVAHRLAYRWLYMIARNAADYNGTVPEKYDVVARSHRVFAEYGNVGTDFAYITKEGFGWMNASFQVGLALLPQALRAPLERLVPPEWLFAETKDS